MKRSALTLPVVGLMLPLLVVSLILLAGMAPSAHAVSRGIVDQRLEEPGNLSDAQIAALVAEMGPGNLKSRWTRVLVSWARLQPSDPATGAGYDAAYVATLDKVVDALRGAKMTVMFTSTDVPAWARDMRYAAGANHETDIAMRIGDSTVRREFTEYAEFLAAHFAGRVRHFEVWNEPNLGSGIFPQAKNKKIIGPAVYLKMLKAYYAGAGIGSRKAIVIAGATAPRGTGRPSARSTSPQWFAKYLKSKRANKWFHAYSHHPYTPGGSRNAAPNRMPNNPSRCVTLANLNVLMKLFKGKSFYLTEFAYNTHQSKLFGLKVSDANQARYLRQAYSMVRRYKRVKALLWYTVRDWSFQGRPATEGVYCGLVEKDGTRKLAWYAFAQGNRLSVTAPSSVKSRKAFTVSGTLKTRLGLMEGQRVTLQKRGLSARKWSKLATTKTLAGGTYAFTIKQSKSMRYRVVWDGVCESSQKKVRSR